MIGEKWKRNAGWLKDETVDPTTNSELSEVKRIEEWYTYTDTPPPEEM